MQSGNRVVWTEGMFLRVQHFQQSDRWTEALVQAAVRDMEPYRWGLAEISLDRDLLNIGKFGLASCRGTMPDGTTFSVPDDTDPPPPLELTRGDRGLVVYLTVPLRQQGSFETGTERLEDFGTRLRRTGYDAPDANSGSFASASLEVGRSRLAFVMEGRPTAGYALLPIARVVEVRSDLSVVLDERFIAPCLNCAVQPMLNGFLAELQGLITHRAEAIAARIADPSVRGTAEIADFMLLQTMNRNEPLLRHLVAAAPVLHPESFYRHCLALAGELATYTSQSRRATQFPPYLHEDLYATFTVFATFALGTALGDFTANSLNLGYLPSGLLFLGIILLPLLAWWRFGLNPIAAFWMAYVVTRPLGASFADWISKPSNLTGINFGDGPTALAFAVAVLVLVVYLAIARPDVQSASEVLEPSPAGAVRLGLE